MCSNIPESRSSQQTVANRMAQNVRVGVAQQPFLKRYLHSTQHELSPLHQSMQIVADAYSKRFAHKLIEKLRLDRFGKPQIERTGDLYVHRRAFDHGYLLPKTLYQL